MEDVEQEAGAARPGAHDAPDAVAAHDTIDTAEAHAAKAAATAAPKRPKSAEEIMRLVEDKAAAEEGAPQGGSAGGGSQKTAAEGEEGAIADGTHLATGHMDVGMVRSKASKQDKKENVCITDMARRVRNWGIAKPQNAQHSAWTWGFKYKNPPKCAAGFHGG